MRPFLSIVLFLGFLELHGVGAEIVLNQRYPEVVLRDGRVLKDVTFVALGAETAMARWEGGMGTIKLSLLPDELSGAPKGAASSAPAKVPASTSVLPFDREKAPSAETLASQSLAAEGGAALLALHAIRFQGEVGPLGTGSPMVMTAAQPNYRLTEVLLPQGRYFEGFGPKGSWSATQKGGALPVVAKAPANRGGEKNVLEESFIEPIWRWKELNAQLEVIGEELVAGQDGAASVRTYVVSVTFPDGFRCDYLIPSDDAKTPYLVKRTYRSGTIVGTERRSRFRHIGDLFLPTQYDVEGGDGTVVEMRFFRVVPDPVVDPGIFTAPTNTAPAKGGRI